MGTIINILDDNLESSAYCIPNLKFIWFKMDMQRIRQVRFYSIGFVHSSGQIEVTRAIKLIKHNLTKSFSLIRCSWVKNDLHPTRFS